MKKHMDLLSFLGIFLAILAVSLGWVLEGGSLEGLLNLPAFIIVFGGTLGAVLIQTPYDIMQRAFRILPWILKPPSVCLHFYLEKLVRWSHVSRRDGLLGLEKFVSREPDLFLKKGLELLVDGNEPEVIRNVLLLELENKEEHDLEAMRFFEAMGGYSPTIGIIGAVMGLIHVMGNLDDPSKLGAGVAVAFVATIYGVGFANLLLLPISRKLSSIISKQSLSRELIIEGLIGIADGENHRALEKRLKGFLK